MDMEHRRDRHVHIFAVQSPLRRRASDVGRHAERVQYQLAMAEIDAFGQPGGARGVEHRCLRVLVEIGEVIIRAGIGQQSFVFRRKSDRLFDGR